jgi:hypothetical protein
MAMPPLEAVKRRLKKVREGRLGVPPEVPHVEPHNTWVVNQPGTLLVIPVAKPGAARPPRLVLLSAERRRHP